MRVTEYFACLFEIFVSSSGVFSTALVSPPASSYCVQGARFSFGEVDSTVTIQQTQVPTCPNQLDVVRNDFLSIGNDPVTDNIARFPA